jgi:tetratricopeptide (TPR) repeat protein
VRCQHRAPTRRRTLGHGRRAAALAIALAFCFAVAAKASAGDQADTISSALGARDYDRAIELTREALKTSPNDARIWTLQGIAFARKGDNTGALAAYRHALTLSPDYVPALEGAAQLQYQAGSRDAVPLLTHLLRLRPDDPTGHAMLAVLEYREGNCQSATSHFAAAGALLDSELDALHAYGTCLVRLKQLEDATRVFRRTVALRPDDARERRLLASIQLMASKPREAVDTLIPILESGAVDSDTLELASSAYEEAGDTARAVSTLRQAILLDPRNPNLYVDFANIAFAHQSFQVGIDVVHDGISLQPQAASLYLARGVLYVQLAEYDKAEADFEKANELDPNQSLSAAAQGLAAVEANDLDHALATVQKRLASKPEDPLLLYVRADILAQKGVEPGTPEFRMAVSSARKAVALRPSLAPARSVLAKLYLQAGQTQAAIGQCRKALASDPNDQTSVYRLIQALRKTGDTSEIPDLLKRLARLREQAAQQERERYRYKLIEGERTPPPPSPPR